MSMTATEETRPNGARPEAATLPTYERAHGLHVLRLRGDDYEMGLQHGRALREAIGRGPLPYFDAYVRRMFTAAAGPRLGALGAALLQRTVGRKIAAGFPERARRGIEGLADGARLDRRAVMGAVTMPETYLWVLRQVLGLRRPSLAPRHGVPMMGCTSAVAWGGATVDRALYHGRNFDYQGVGAWDTEQAVVFHAPVDGQRYVSIAAAGILFGGITAMNEAGLSLVVHQHLASESFALGGTPVGVVGDEIMRHARSLDDARRILDAHRPNGCWTYVIASGREGAVLCYEVTPKGRAALRFDDETFGYANVYLDPELGATEHYLYPAQWRNNLGRFARVRELLARERGSIDANAVASMLGDTGTGCPFEGSIAMLMTVASVVFRPQDGAVWVATGRAPASLGSFVPFSLATESVHAREAMLDGPSKASAGVREAWRAYREAYEAYFNDDDVARARVHVKRATEAAPEAAAFHAAAGLLALRAGDARDAEAALDRAIALGHTSDERLCGMHLWRGRARDALGRRAAALEDYRAALGGDALVRSAAEKGRRRAWKRGRFAIEMAFGDVPVA
jgi:tetratricopeptide (TPR) repeat protein